jgi:SAM-dependent methyltransferase
MKKIINKIYHQRLFSWLFPTTVFCLRKKLSDCETVLDLGCGPSSPLQYCKNIQYSVGVETFPAYLEKTKRRKIHSNYMEIRVEEVDFPEKSFDAVIMIEVLEHLPEKIGYEILRKAEKWARKKVIVSTPSGFLPQEAYDGNPFQKHLSGWDVKKMESMGFQCWGLSGLRFVRQTNPTQISANQDDFMASIRLRPKFFWFVIATLSQFFVYYFPERAFEIFCAKEIK